MALTLGERDGELVNDRRPPSAGGIENGREAPRLISVWMGS
jgi:hypothetical protein